MLPDVFTPMPSAAKEHRKADVRARLAQHPLPPEAEAVYAALVSDVRADR